MTVTSPREKQHNKPKPGYARSASKAGTDEAEMDYNWSREEIALTRRAWIMKDMDEELRKHEMYHNIFTGVCRVLVATSLVWILTWVLI